MNVNPLGSCALAGTTYNTDRYMTAQKLGIDGIWLTVVFVEIASFIVVVGFFLAFRNKYGYGKEREVCL